MKIILSRKGFDSTWGGVPSPIFPSQEMFSLPIPGFGRHNYKQMSCGAVNAGKLVEDLEASIKGTAISRGNSLHLDPDLRKNAVQRASGPWSPCFGQANAAQGHLEKNGVTEGDVFLFFGSFRKVNGTNGKWNYVKNAPTTHVIFGWLQIGEIHKIADNAAAVPEWLKYHDHYHAHLSKQNWAKNTIYEAAPGLTIDSKATAFDGSGVFTHFNSELQLTHEPEGNRNKSLWSLPDWFHPSGKARALSYHGNPKRWTRKGDRVLLSSVSKGQEFVLDCDEYPESKAWLMKIMKAATVTP